MQKFDSPMNPRTAGRSAVGFAWEFYRKLEDTPADGMIGGNERRQVSKAGYRICLNRMPAFGEKCAGKME